MLKLPEKQCAPQELNNLNRPRSGAVTSKAGNMHWADQWPICMQSTKRDTMGVMAEHL